MSDLIRLGENTFYTTGMFHVGVYVINKYKDYSEVCLIDSGLDADYAENIDKILFQYKFHVKLIINTHYHADHAGGNAYFEKKYGCKIVSTKVNAALISNYDVCPAIVWGSKPVNVVLNNYFYAESTNALDIEDIRLPKGIELINLPGHSLSMIGVKTSDLVVFLGDGLVDYDTLEKHKLTYLYDIDNTLSSLEIIKDIEAKVYVPYHVEPLYSGEEMRELADYNIKVIKENLMTIKRICKLPRTLDEVISTFFTMNGYKLTLYRYAVEGGIVKGYLSHLLNNGEVEVILEGNYVKWKTIMN